MTAQPHAADPAHHPDPSQDQAPAAVPTRSGRLLGLLRKLIDHGKQLLGTLQQNPSPERVCRIGERFGTWLNLILARITRALEMAAQLETRIADHPDRFDRARPAHTGRTPAARKPLRPAPQPQNQADSPLADLPTAKEIADEFRRRPVGAVLVEICGNLGLMPADPLRQEVRQLAMAHGGSLFTLCRDVRKRVAPSNFIHPDVRFVWPKLTPWSELPLSELPLAEATPTFTRTGTGPP